ncbi:MAG: ATPase [Gammaproteobacteria bacterium]|nr:ATPase [Gammaproteobacteria bacterium]MBU1777391.1 ATPase [Gammaproteobacteria bacterium]MBU1970125.1 ATPase [Gammaproteobacteria bacterium]
MHRQTHPPGFKFFRREQLLQETVHDAYQARGKLPEPTLCPDCGAVYHDGHWQWLSKPAHAHESFCPACQRIRERDPAGYVMLSGSFFAAHEQEILQQVRHHEATEKTSHPLQRIMDIENTDNGILITTTDIHLARGIGEALHHAYRGELEFHYNPEQYLLRVIWTR